METKKSLKDLVLSTAYDKRAIIVWLIVGLIFLSEGIQKYLFPELICTGRFEKIGFTNPAFWAYFAGTFEILRGSFVLIGFFSRLASIPLFIIMMTAFVTTKWPILIDKGLWAMAHEYRTDFVLTLLLVYLFIYGALRWSFDIILFNHRDK
jgi:putative oxidoreductase